MRSIFSTMSMLSGCREIVTVSNVAIPPEGLRWSCKIRSWNSCPMPQVSQAEIFPRLLGIWEILWILTGLPQMTDTDHVMPLGWKCFCSLDIRRANFSAVRTKKIICKQSYVKNAKLMSVLKFFENAFFHKNKWMFCKMYCQLVILPQALRSQDTFRDSMLLN